MLNVLWYSCENTVLELDHVSLDFRENCCFDFNWQNVFWGTKSECGNKQHWGKGSACYSLSSNSSAEVTQFLCFRHRGISGCFGFSASKCRSISCLQPTTIWTCGSDFQFIPKPEIFWWQFAPSFQGTMRSKLSKTSFPWPAWDTRTSIFFFFLTNLKYC